MVRGKYMWFEKGCIVVGGAEDLREIPIILKGRRRMMQTEEHVFLPCDDHQEPLSDSHINCLLG